MPYIIPSKTAAGYLAKTLYINPSRLIRQCIKPLNRTLRIDSKRSLDLLVASRQNPFMPSILLHHINPARNRARFYALSVEPTLFGETGLLRHWGRLGTKGRYRLDLYPSQGAALLAQAKMERAKRRRGYVQINPADKNSVLQSAYLTKTTAEKSESGR